MQTLPAKFLRLIFSFCLLALSLVAQENDSAVFKDRPANHEKNRQLTATAYEANLKKFKGDTNILVLPGLIADRQNQRVEVTIENTRLAPGTPCEFTVIAEASEHAYEASLISFAKPSAVHEAMKFIGRKPGQTRDPTAMRFWARGETFILSLVKSNASPVRLEKMFVDRRTDKTLREEGFRFTGSRRVPAVKDPQKDAYAADEYQPMAIVSLFNTPDSVFEVPYAAEQSEVYQNTISNPETALTEGELMTLRIEPPANDAARPVKDLDLEVRARPEPGTNAANGLQQLKNMVFQLKDASVALNEKTTVSAMLEAITKLDRDKTDYYLTVHFGGDVTLGGAQAVAKILTIIDCDRGVRVNPPEDRQLFYRAFTPNRELLDRASRPYHPWELALTEKNGVVSGKLLRVDATWKQGASAAELEYAETPIANPKALVAVLNAKVDFARRPPILMVYAPGTLTYAQLAKYLEPLWPAYKVIHVYVDEPMPAMPERKQP